MIILIVLNQASQIDKSLAYDFVIGVDGGCQFCMQQDIKMDLAIGDFDSLNEGDFKRLSTYAKNIKQYDVVKNESDFELALNQAMIKQPSQLIVYGVFGGRDDHSISNLFNLFKIDPTIAMFLPGVKQNAYLLANNHGLTMQGEIGAIVSLLAVPEHENTITTQGLKYPLNSQSLLFGTSRGLSNQLDSNKATINIENGKVLVILDCTIKAKILKS